MDNAQANQLQKDTILRALKDGRPRTAEQVAQQAIGVVSRATVKYARETLLEFARDSRVRTQIRNHEVFYSIIQTR